MKEAALIALAQSQVDDETVTAAGVFQPRGTSAGLQIGDAGAVSGLGHGVAGAVGGLVAMAAGTAAGRGLSIAEHLPRWTLMAVTATKLYAFHVLSPTDGIEFEMAGLFRMWSLDQITVHGSGRVGTKVFVVDDTAARHSYEFEGFRWGWQHSNVVMNVFGGDGPRSP